MQENSKKYLEVIEAAKLADESVVWYWERVVDLDEIKTEAIRENDIEKFEQAQERQENLIKKITWEEKEVLKLNKKLKELA